MSPYHYQHFKTQHTLMAQYTHKGSRHKFVFNIVLIILSFFGGATSSKISVIIVSALSLGRQTNYTRSGPVGLTVTLFICTYYGYQPFLRHLFILLRLQVSLNWKISVNCYLYRQATIIHNRWGTLFMEMLLFSQNTIPVFDS